MTHTLHRYSGQTGLDNDYVILVMPARGVNNDEGVVEKLRNYLRIFVRHNPVNIGGMGTGNLVERTAEEIIGSVYREIPMIHGVFTRREDVIEALKEIKAADMGLSVIVTGLVDAADCCTREAGLGRHSVNYSLGIWGDKTLLPDRRYLEITSLCGHSMISVNLVKKFEEEINSGRMTIDQAAEELARPCVCSVFNVEKAKRVLEDLIG